MPGDLGPCPGHGLVVASGVTLDGAGHRLSGLGDGSEQYGVYLHGAEGATVKNVEVTRFLQGIRLRQATGNRILDNRVLQNGHLPSRTGYGINLAGGSRRNLIRGNSVVGSGDEGIHVGTGGHLNEIVANRISESSREHLYVLGSDGLLIEGNTLGGGGTTALYIKNSKALRVVGNTILDRPAHIVGDSRDICFARNDLVRASLRVEAPEPPHARC